MNYKKAVEVLGIIFDLIPIEERNQVNIQLSAYEEKNDYKGSYELLMDYWDMIPENEREDIHNQLNDLGL